MKKTKIFSFAISVLFVFTLFLTGLPAKVKAADSYISIAKKTENQPVVDGDLNEAEWDISIPIEKTDEPACNNKARYGALWDESYLYIGVEVEDDKIVTDSPSISFYDDSVEIYIDRNNNKTTSYEEDDRQFIVRYGDTTVYPGASSKVDTSDILALTKETDTGYKMEIAIPWSHWGDMGTPSVDDIIGFNIFINDDDDGGEGDTLLAWKLTGACWNDTSNFGELQLTGVVEKVQATGVKLNKDNLTLNVGQSEVLTATVEPENADDKTVIWSSDDSTIATVDENGNVTAVKEGTTVVKATTNDGGFAANCNVTVDKPIEGKAAAKKAESQPVVDGDLNEAEWDISIPIEKTDEPACNNKARYGALWDESYLYIGVEVEDDNIVTDSPDISFYDDSVEIYLDRNNHKTTSYEEDDRQFIVRYGDTKVYPGGATNAKTDDILALTKKTDNGYNVEIAVPWSHWGDMGTPSIDDIIGFNIFINDDDDGGEGDTLLAWKLTGACWNDTSNFGELQIAGVSSEKVKATGVKLNKDNLILNAGQSEKLTATVEPENAGDKTVIWSSSNPTVATVDANGNVTAVKEGTTVVKVTTKDGGFAANCNVSVLPISYSDISLEITANAVDYFIDNEIMYTITVTNNSEVDKTNIIVNDILPNGVEYLSDSPQGGYNKDTGLWTIKSLKAKESTKLFIIAKINLIGQIDNIATINNGNESIVSCATMFGHLNIPIVKDYNAAADEYGKTSGIIEASDKEGIGLTYSLYESHSGSDVTVDSLGNWTYKACVGFTGEDSFTVKVENSEGLASYSTVNVKVDVNKTNNNNNNDNDNGGYVPPVVVPVNNSPITQNNDLTTDINTKISGNVVASDKDGDKLEYTVSTMPTHGKVTIDNSTGSWEYVPENDYVGKDSFKVTITDGKGGQATSQINVEIKKNEVTDKDKEDNSNKDKDKDKEDNQKDDTQKDNKEVRITAKSGLRVRGAASINSSKIGLLKYGTKIKVIGYEKEWYIIEFNGVKGYISAKYVELVKEESNQSKPNGIKDVTITTKSGLRVRSAASVGSSRLGLLKYGAKVTVLDSENGWYKINYNGGYGYIFAKYTK